MSCESFVFTRFKFAHSCVMRYFLILCLYSLENSVGGVTPANATSICAGYASPRSEEFQIGAAWNEPTRNIVTFYSALLAAGKLDEADLLRIRHGLVRGELVNPFPRIGRPATENNLFAKQVANLLIPQVNTGHVLVWIDGELHVRGKEFVQREERKTETQKLFRDMRWIRVKSGTFEWNGKSTTLNQSFLVSDTLITQSQWIEVMGENPSYFSEGDETLDIPYRDKQTGKIRYVRGQPNHPVEDLTWYSAAEFSNRLSILNGLQPVYDFSRLVQTPGTRAENGTLDFTAGQIFVNAPNGDIYKAKGIRFLTESERLALYSKAGAHKNSDSEMLDPDWIADNTGNLSHAVAKISPHSVEGYLIYDLFGNVGSWLNDGWAQTSSISASINPQIEAHVGLSRVVWGAKWTQNVDVCRFVRRDGLWPGNGHNGVGLSLARTVE